MNQSRPCSHVMPDGDPCRAVSLKNSTLCYFHSRQKARNKHLRHALVRRTMLFGAAGRGPAIAVGMANVPGTRDTFDELSANMFDQMDLPALDNPVAIQLLVTQVTHALLLNMIHPRIAGRALYACQIATSNLANMRYFSPSSKVTVDPDPIPDVPEFEELYASIHGKLEKYRAERNQMAAQEEREAMLQKPEFKQLRELEERYARMDAAARKEAEAKKAAAASQETDAAKNKKPPTPVGPINAMADDVVGPAALGRAQDGSPVRRYAPRTGEGARPHEIRTGETPVPLQNHLRTSAEICGRMLKAEC